MANADTPTELDTLKAKLAAREGQSGFTENVKALRARIAQIEAQETTDGE